MLLLLLPLLMILTHSNIFVAKYAANQSQNLAVVVHSHVPSGFVTLMQYVSFGMLLMEYSETNLEYSS